MIEFPKRKLQVFLCHASADKPVVRDLYKRLVKDGIDAWLDVEKLIPGQDWRLEIAKAVRESDIVVVCLSKGSVTKEGYVQKEIKFALDCAEEKPDGTVFVIPARLEDCDVPERLSRWQWVDLFDENGYTRLRKSLDVRTNEIFIEPPSTGKGVKTPKSTEELFREAIEIDLKPHRDPERVLQLYKQVRDIDPYFRNIDSMIRRLENEIRIKHADLQQKRLPKLSRLFPSIQLITILVLVAGILLGVFAIRSYFANLTHKPTISISSVVRDLSGNPIDINSAPFQVSIKGTVSNANGYYVYLIVADKYHHYVQPGLGPNVDSTFSNLCQLGTMGAGFGQQYTIYAVITYKAYADFAFFEGEPYIAKSKELRMTRELMPTLPVTP